MPLQTPGVSASTPVQAKKRQSTSRTSKYSVNRLIAASLTLPSIQKHGFTHPRDGRWLTLPPEFDELLDLETKAVTQVVLVVLRKTVGVPGDGPYKRGQWVRLSVRDIATTRHMQPGAAQRGLKVALEKGYLKRRPTAGKQWEYSVHWRGIDD
jgi:hypothetical protein